MIEQVNLRLGTFQTIDPFSLDESSD